MATFTCIDCRAAFAVDMDAHERARRERRRGPSVLWCPVCDEARIARITASLKAIGRRLGVGDDA